jgi:hypothetical protein
MPASPSREPSPHQFESPTDSPHQCHQKKEEDHHLHTEDTSRAKFEQLRLARLIRHDPKAMKLDMQTLQP